jgi:hypothetical protein
VIDAHRQLEAAIARRLTGRRGRPLYVWGAGEGGRLAAARLTAQGVRVDAFVDCDPAKASTRLPGRRLLAPGDVVPMRPRPRVVIASMYWREIAAQLRAAGWRLRRDFEVFPVDGAADVPGLAAGLTSSAARYSAWRREWLSTLGLCRPGTRPETAVLAWPSPRRAPGTRSRIGHWERRLPPDDQRVVLYDARAGRVQWRWTHAGATAAVPGAGIYDSPPPSGRLPFLLRALAGAAALAPPIACRAGDVRRFLASPHRGDCSLRTFGDWLRRQPPGLAVGVAGVCTLSRREEPAIGQPGSGGAAPGLVAFAAHLAAAGEAVFSADEVAAVTAGWTTATDDAAPGFEYLRAGRRRLPRRPSLQVLVHSQGNFFFREIRDFLVRAWRRAGARVAVGDERSRRVASARAVVVAPHEFFVLDGRRRDWDHAADLVLVNTEQPQTVWFARCLDRLLTAAHVFDLNWQTALVLRTLGVDAHFLPLGIDPTGAATALRRRLPRTPALAGLRPQDRRLPRSRAWTARPIDILFVGTLSPRRAAALAAAAPALARYRCFLHLPPSVRPLSAGSADALDARDMADLCRRSKIVLNVHRDALPYCEWHRVVYQAMQHGALVVSEPMLPMPAFAPGRHFVSTAGAALPATLRGLLDRPDGARRAARIAARARAVLARRFHADRIARRALGVL